MSKKRVVVTGLGALTPIGNNVEEYWNALLEGKSGAAPITNFDASKFKTRFACELKNVDIDGLIGRRLARRIDPFIQFAIISSDEAVKDAGLAAIENKERIGVMFTSGIGGLTSLQAEITTFATGNGIPRYNPFLVPKMIIDAAAGHISIRNGFKGLSCAVVTACASSTHAMSLAYDQIRLGRADVIVTGGAEASITEVGVGGFNALRALSTNNDNPAGASKPYDQNRDGFVLGEGSGTIVLEDYEHAKARGAKIYAEVAGSAITADAYHQTAPHPEGEGAERVIRLAMENAGLTADLIDYVNAHSTSTSLGDAMEVKAIQNALGEHAYKTNISSTKSMTGHLLGAAGAIESIACILSVRNNIVPPTINLDQVDEVFDQNLNFTANKAQKREVRTALNNNFGFGGHNSSMIFKKFEE